MQVTKITSPTALAVSLDEVKDHLRIERDDVDFDVDLDALIRAAQSYIESETHQTIIDTTYEAVFDDFPSDALLIPGWPIQSIGSITYYDELGAQIPLGSYQSDLSKSPVRICPVVGEPWPVTQAGRIGAVKVQFTAGYGTSDITTPPMLKAMVKLLVAHWFKNREGITNKGTPMSYPLAFEALRDQVRVNEFVEFEVKD